VRESRPLPPPPSEQFPVYPLLWHPIRTRTTPDRAPNGRVIGVEYNYDYQPSEPEFQCELAPNDVVWIPLYAGTIDQAPKRRDVPRGEYDANLNAIAQIAPRVRAVLVGNANAEICYDANLRTNHRLCVDFVAKHGALIRPYGRPAFAPVFDILVYDCYEGDGRLRNLLIELDAIVLCYAGCWWLFENPKPWIPEPPPRGMLAEYLGSMTAWSAVGLRKGLEAGSGQALHGMGFRAGFMGYF